MTEWKAHNAVLWGAQLIKNTVFPISQNDIERVMHTDFDFKDENTTYVQYLIRAFTGVY